MINCHRKNRTYGNPTCRGIFIIWKYWNWWILRLNMTSNQVLIYSGIIYCKFFSSSYDSSHFGKTTCSAWLELLLFTFNLKLFRTSKFTIEIEHKPRSWCENLPKSTARKKMVALKDELQAYLVCIIWWQNIAMYILHTKSNSSHLQIVMILDRSVLTLLNSFFFAMKFIDLIDFIQLLLNQCITYQIIW